MGTEDIPDLLHFIGKHPSLFYLAALWIFVHKSHAAAAGSWGRDVGRLYGWNTLVPAWGFW